MDVKKTLETAARSAYTIILSSGNTAQEAPFLARLFGEGATLASFFNATFKTAIVVGAMLAVLRIGHAGFMYMTTDAFGTMNTAKRTISEVVMGLLLLLATWLILNQINPQILNLDILRNITPAPQQPSQTQQPVQSAGARPTGPSFLAPNQDPSLNGAPSAFTNPDGSPLSP